MHAWPDISRSETATASGSRRIVPPWTSALPAGIEILTREIRSTDLDLLPEPERRLVARSSPARQAQFATGRCLLHAATSCAEPIGRQANGAPALPGPARASLAHDDGVAVVGVVRRAHPTGLGIDVERVSELPAEVRDVLANDSERAIDPLALHVIKEAVYKAWSSSGGGLLAPRQIAVRLHRERFVATIRSDDVRPLLGVHGRWGDRMIAVAFADSPADGSEGHSPRR